MNSEARRSTPLFPMGVVISLTELSARQIRYYEEHELVHPVRTEGKTRLFSFNDIDRLLEIKALLEKGLNIAGIKEVLNGKKQEDSVIMEFHNKEDKPTISEAELRKILRAELRQAGRLNRITLRQGDMARFFDNK